ncbi:MULTISPECIES: DNA gyrase inhibitor YacG [Pseudomonas syringae group]|uniref:DNA gyrase inhibitor YacG n=2 Tax=Pseudomonas syringae group TaxID=136849 RepID=A0A2K4X0B5_PSESX|nr:MULTISPECIES: DNA gyrase inhibitor YacG [Pseudomonas syringae group]AVB13290.1 DNA gyrase inhibitor YacG [Pseudomonas amygdali pv. morsprunorum]KWS50521.1 DNA gyrase inhibitor [Pseudomonas amygdali pv. morsprunorum]KWS66866.1 DNA gyrase inhibitor [Pseudomonas amygdali pv. morsprunorum]MBI6730871.1 DNA gyrase inhibitor YacG [Pseudomonas amygdali]MBI6809851.1 DNA gyrase inhibitor YacG [Pseudomonas amygdali]
MSQPMTVQCPTCDAPVEWSAASPSRPFCSARCKLIDLGAWASEEHAIPVSPDAEDELFSGDLEAPHRGH